MSVVVVVGNPKPASRTAECAGLLAQTLTGSPPDALIDVVTLGAGLLSWEDDNVKRAVDTAAKARLLIVASPTFKATYSGLVKVFLDNFATGDGLRGVVTVPMMMGASPIHYMAPELLLKPVLVELGATCPAPGIFLQEKTYSDGTEIKSYVERWGEVLNVVCRKQGMSG